MYEFGEKKIIKISLSLSQISIPRKELTSQSFGCPNYLLTKKWVKQTKQTLTKKNQFANPCPVVWISTGGGGGGGGGGKSDANCVEWIAQEESTALPAWWIWRSERRRRTLSIRRWIDFGPRHWRKEGRAGMAWKRGAHETTEGRDGSMWRGTGGLSFKRDTSVSHWTITLVHSSNVYCRPMSPSPSSFSR